MVGALAQSAILSASIISAKQCQIKASYRSKQGVKLCNTLRYAKSLNMSGFSSLDRITSIGTIGCPKRRNFQAAISLRSAKRKGNRRVVVAMFERYTEKAIKVIMLSQEESRLLGHYQVGTEQILLGLIGEGTGIAAKMLKSVGINLKEAWVEVEKISGRGTGFVGVEIPFTTRAKHVLELAFAEAQHLGHNYIGSENLLLALLTEGEGVTASVLENLGADLTNIHAQVIRLIGESAEAVTSGGAGAGSRNKMSTLEEYRKNLT